MQKPQVSPLGTQANSALCSAPEEAEQYWLQGCSLTCIAGRLHDAGSSSREISSHI